MPCRACGGRGRLSARALARVLDVSRWDVVNAERRRLGARRGLELLDRILLIVGERRALEGTQ